MKTPLQTATERLKEQITYFDGAKRPFTKARRFQAVQTIRLLESLLDEEEKYYCDFGNYLDSLSHVQRCTVHSVSGTGLFQKSMKQLYDKFTQTFNDEP